MAKYTSKDMGIKMDNGSGVITDISGSVNQASLEKAITILGDTALGDSNHTTLYGLGQAPVLNLNGFLDSTMEPILGPIVANGTSLAKTMEYKMAASKFLNGEFNLENVKISGDTDTLQTWSMYVVGVGTLNRTSKALS